MILNTLDPQLLDIKLFDYVKKSIQLFITHFDGISYIPLIICRLFLWASTLLLHLDFYYSTCYGEQWSQDWLLWVSFLSVDSIIDLWISSNISPCYCPSSCPTFPSSTSLQDQRYALFFLLHSLARTTNIVLLFLVLSSGPWCVLLDLHESVLSLTELSFSGAFLVVDYLYYWESNGSYTSIVCSSLSLYMLVLLKFIWILHWLPRNMPSLRSLWWNFTFLRLKSLWSPIRYFKIKKEINKCRFIVLFRSMILLFALPSLFHSRILSTS